jgi:hypothetical protein
MSSKLSLNSDLFQKIAVKVILCILQHHFHDLSWMKLFGIKKEGRGKVGQAEKMSKDSLIYISNKSRLEHQGCKNKLKIPKWLS